MPRCAEVSCSRWRPERLAPGWAVGIRLNGTWYCSRTCVLQAAKAGLADELIEARQAAGEAGEEMSDALPLARRRLKLGVILRQFNAVSDQELIAALGMQRISGSRLGAELISRGQVSPEHVLRALAAQESVSYLTTFDTSRVTRGPSWMPVEAVRALGLIPFDYNNDLLKVYVICAAPVPRAAVRALQKLSGFTPEVYLVNDSIWEQALREYRTAPDTAGTDVVTVSGLDDAAAVVADTASADRAVTMRHVRWDRFTWVQVEGPTQVSNVLVPDAMEGTCQVAPTPL
jgi:hypothetical protein